MLETQADDETVRQRLRERELHADEVSDARLEDFERLRRLYEAPLEQTPARCIPVPTTRPVEETVVWALRRLAQMQIETTL